MSIIEDPAYKIFLGHCSKIKHILANFEQYYFLANGSRGRNQELSILYHTHLIRLSEQLNKTCLNLRLQMLEMAEQKQTAIAVCPPLNQGKLVIKQTETKFSIFFVSGSVVGDHHPKELLRGSPLISPHAKKQFAEILKEEYGAETIVWEE